MNVGATSARASVSSHSCGAGFTAVEGPAAGATPVAVPGRVSQRPHSLLPRPSGYCRRSWESAARLPTAPVPACAAVDGRPSDTRSAVNCGPNCLPLDVLGRWRLRRLAEGRTHDLRTLILDNVRFDGRQLGDLISPGLASDLAAARRATRAGNDQTRQERP